MEKELHIISHTHWDREWYMSFAKHRFRLVQFMDTLINTLENDEEFRSFHLDGQVIILDDYLEVRPEMIDRVKAQIEKGKLRIGPMYILQDEFLISGEANIRNMIVGLQECKKYGKPVMTGYFPDAFGNISQMPQILRGFDIDAACFGRGKIITLFLGIQDGFENEHDSEVIWSSPDGSDVLAVQLTFWYNNCDMVDERPEEAVKKYNTLVENLSKVAHTPYLLALNGSDHLPVQTNLPKAISNARDKVDYKIVHSDFESYINLIRPYKDSFFVMEGELISQKTHGYGQLINTASARLYLKQQNHKAQYLLENMAEPLSVMSLMFNKEYDSDMLYYSWKRLLQNHPHDSICGCSIDEVHRDMECRFRDVIDTSESLISDIKHEIALKVKTLSDKNLIVFNSNTEPASGYIEFDADFSIDEEIPDQFVLKNCRGEKTKAVIISSERLRKIILPKDRFREVQEVIRLKMKALLKDINPLGYEVFALKNGTVDAFKDKASNNYFENAKIRIDFNKNGSFDLTYKKTGKKYTALNTYEDTNDIGDEYNYTQYGEIRTTAKDEALISLLSCDEVSTSYIVKNSIKAAKYINKAEKTESTEKVDINIESVITIDKDSDIVKIQTVIDNQACDHRIRALFPTCLDVDTTTVDGHFDFIKRDINPPKGWANPSNCQRMNGFVYHFDNNDGIVIASRGLPEYEALRDENKTIALTLLRAVGELGDWMYFPTPDAQCIGKVTSEYAVIPFDRENIVSSVKNAADFVRPKLTAFQTGRNENASLPYENSILTIKTNDMIFTSAVKKAEDSDGIIVRLYNPTENEGKITINTKLFTKIVPVKLNEQPVDGSQYNLETPITIAPKKIVTLLLQ